MKDLEYMVLGLAIGSFGNALSLYIGININAQQQIIAGVIWLLFFVVMSLIFRNEE